MDFAEMKKIWDEQNRVFYGINEETLHKSIHSKRRQARRIVNATEIFVIATYLASGIFVGLEFLDEGAFFLIALSAWMTVSGLYFLIAMIQRKINDNRFDKTLNGELNDAISAATQQVRLSQSVRLNTLPIVAIVLFGAWQEGRPLWFGLAVLVFFAFIFYASGLEHKIYKRRKQNLEGLRSTLTMEG